MKNPWKILEISPTSDPEEIKKAYRALAQKYHPDKARTPEKQRKYTVHFVEIRKAYETALQYAERQSTAPERSTSSQVSGAPAGNAAPWQEWVKAVFILVGGATGILLLAVVGKYALSFPESHLFPITFGVVLGISVGHFVGFFLFLFLMMFYMPVVVILEKLRLGKYTDKFGWALSVMLWLFVISLIGLPELNVRKTTNAVIWFVAFGFGPVFGLGTWVVDYIKYRRAKGHYLSVIANPSTQPTPRSGG